VIVDHNLTGVQLRNMEEGTGCRVIDRTQLILDIFATHARTREGQLQVELAQLNYLLPRLTGRGEKLSRLGGGIGTRGPGEQKLETDRRRIRDRVRKIQQTIETFEASEPRVGEPARQFRLECCAGWLYERRKIDALQCSDARVGLDLFKYVRDTRSNDRGIRLPSRRRVLLSDTVGFFA